MADENKLVGAQYLKLGQLREDVNTANELLKSIGRGVDLNLASTISSQLKQQLNDIVKATQDAASTTKQLTSQISSSTTGIASSIGKQAKTEAQYINQLTSLYKQYYSIKVKMQATDPKSHKATVLSSQETDLKNQIDAIENLNAKYSQHEKVLKAVADGERNLKIAKASAQDKREAEEMKKTSEAVKKASESYNQLKAAYTNYDKAVKRGDGDSASYWQSQIVAQQAVLTSLESQLDTLGLNETQRKKINDLIQQGKDLEAQHTKNLDDANNKMKETATAADRVADSILRWVSSMLIMKSLSSLWNNAIDFAEEYYNQQNEIRIVTGMTESEAEHLGSRYIQMAQDMSVASRDIASAAVEFYRQGLGDAETEDRLKWTTMYAKIAKLEFQDAAELVTAATNSMDLDTQRVVDVFAYLGDASASG